MNIQDKLRQVWESKALPFLRSLSPKQRFLSIFGLVVLLLWLLRICSDIEDSRLTEQSETEQLSEWIEQTDTVAAKDSLAVESEGVDQGSTPEGAAKEWPYYRRPIRSWREPEFNDLQDVQIIAATQNGLKHPIVNRQMADEEVDKGDLVFIGANPMYYMDDLTHSVPYLVPKAYRLLNRIGVNFIDSCVSKKLPVHGLVVTSVLRTQSDVDQLKKGNRNASSNSCHQYATTFDISWRNFKEIGTDNHAGQKHTREREIALKNALGEVLRDLRYEGRCYVKHESKQPCFHVTVR